jgi:glycosyltransferase involved in cell wall biosynthesis
MEVSSSRETDEIISAANIEDSVAVVLTTHNDAVYLRDALSSVFAQELHPDEVIMVDDGSTVSPAAIVAEFPTAILLRKNNGGVSSACNLGLHGARCRSITFLDADDRLEPNATASGAACFARRPDAAMALKRSSIRFRSGPPSNCCRIKRYEPQLRFSCSCSESIFMQSEQMPVRPERG